MGGGISKRVIAGAALALLVFARVDGLVLCAALSFDIVFSRNAVGGGIKRRVKVLAQIGGVAFLLYLPWLLFNQIKFGSLLPTSGGAVRYISQLFGGFAMPVSVPTFPPGDPHPLYYLGNLAASFQTLLETPLLFPAGPIYNLLALLSNLTGIFWLSHWVVAGLLLISALFWIRTRDERTNPVILAVALMIFAYSFFVFGFWSFPRYYYPLELLMVVLACGAVHFGGMRIKAFQRKSWAKALVLLYILLFSWHGYMRFGFSDEMNSMHFYKAAKKVDEIVPKGARVGAFQAGTIGYFSSHEVVNLDGVVNPYALKALKQGKLMDYLDSSGIDYVVDTELTLKVMLLDRAEIDQRSRLVPLATTEDGFMIMRIKDPDGF